MTKKELFILLMCRINEIEECYSQDQFLEDMIDVVMEKYGLKENDYLWLFELLDVYKLYVTTSTCAGFVDVYSEMFKLEDDVNLYNSVEVEKIVEDGLRNYESPATGL